MIRPSSMLRISGYDHVPRAEEVKKLKTASSAESPLTQVAIWGRPGRKLGKKFHVPTEAKSAPAGHDSQGLRRLAA
jgi:hypothetical protein